MKTEKTNQKNTGSAKTNVAQKSNNWQSGASSSVGAAIGVTVGSMGQKAFAAEPATEGPVQPPHANIPAATPEESSIHEPVAPQEPEAPATPGNAGEEPHSEESITVLSYQTITCEDGSLMDVAAVRVNGQEALIIDGDRDGTADIMVIDADHNGIITDDELVDIGEAGINMQNLSMAVTEYDMNGDATLLTDNRPMPDYINDADVTGYMA